MALWQMKTLIRDGRVSILFFFNPYPGAPAGPPCLCLCAKKFPASLCNQILFGERSNKLTMWAHRSQRTLPPASPKTKSWVWAGESGSPGRARRLKLLANLDLLRLPRPPNLSPLRPTRHSNPCLDCKESF